MDNILLQVKVQQRLNKLASSDYDNLECWQIAEAFNKAQIEFCRKQIHGNNQKQEGDESSKMLIDDMQKLLNETPLTTTLNVRDKYTEQALPTDYLFYKRVSVKSKPSNIPSICSGCTGSNQKTMKVNLEEVADVDELLNDELSKPSIEWNETFCTLSNNFVKVYTNGDFDVEDFLLSYYRKPVEVQFEGCVNPITDVIYGSNQECEFKDDIAELIIDEAVSILAGDIELFNTSTRVKQNAISNN